MEHPPSYFIYMYVYISQFVQNYYRYVKFFLTNFLFFWES